jgi:hypothetical protein
MKFTALRIIISLLASAGPVLAGTNQFRTDINPALRYYQAFILAPDLAPADREFLFDRDWRGQKLPQNFGELMGRYDSQFRIVREAVGATVECDWGIDLTPGPATLLPHLGRNKQIAQTARLRAMWEWQQGKEAEALDDLIAALELARNCSRDGTLISMLVQIAGENIVASTIAENFYQFSPQTLQQLGEGFDAAPRRGVAVDSIPVEKEFFLGWLWREVVQAQTANPGNDAAVMAKIRDLINGMEGPPEGQPNAEPQHTWQKLQKASGGTSEGIVRIMAETQNLYDKLEALMALPYADYESQLKAFDAEIRSSNNPLVNLGFPAVQKCREKEFSIVAKLAMVRAALEYKLHGVEGFKSVNDPCGQGPFEFQRFTFEGADRGFQLKSGYNGPASPEVMIFVEKEGPPFFVNGPKAGQAVPKAPAKP